MNTKGLILAGGSGSRLFPITKVISKQLLPIYDKPMIYYPLATLMQAEIQDILVITTPHDQGPFKTLLQDGKRWGINISYAVQPQPEGLAQALIIAEEFLDGSPSVLILGDNLFYGEALNTATRKATSLTSGATVFGYNVKNPSEYGVVGFDENRNVISLVEKPVNPASNYAITGLYFYDEKASDFAKQIQPSERGELEITALNQLYLDDGSLTVELLHEGTTWLDTGTHKSLLQAAQFVSVIEERQGRRICCPEVIAYEQNWINQEALVRLAKPLQKSGYGKYLLKVVGRD